MLIDPNELQDDDEDGACVELEFIGGPEHGKKYLWAKCRLRDGITRTRDGQTGVYDVKHVHGWRWVATLRQES